ncbi:unnamed protein product [Arctia plantaginis]|uniref:Envelope fusion protein n=1 Tax=Arctia plantaginis TaxID=874455 RepID=A0A8S1A7I7_ARCPL|nr:unnamed protein product [Arctia plantaginis]
MTHFIQLYRKQTSVIEVEYNILKRSEESIVKQHKIINNHLNYLDRITNTLEKEIDVLSIQQEFTLAAFAAINMIHNLKRIQESFLDTITNLYHGQFNLHLLSPNQLRTELQIVSSQLSKEVVLPVDNIQVNLYKIYKLLKVKARMTDKYFIFEISLPLISRDMFQLYHLIPVPIQLNRMMITIKPLSEYIAINLRRDTYMSASHNDLQICEYQEDTYLCHMHGPVMSLNLEEKFCEKTDSSTCNMIKTSCENKWIRLHDLSTYFYFCCNSYSIKIICDNEIQTRQVSKAGIIQLTRQCIAKGHDVTLYAYQQPENTVNLKLNILDTKFTPFNNLIHNLTLPFQNIETFTSENSHMNDSLKQLGDNIRLLKESEQQNDGLTTHDIHHYTVSYGLLVAAMGAVLWFLWRRRRRNAAPHREHVESVPTSVSVFVNQTEQSSSVSAGDPAPSDKEFNVCNSAREHSFSKRWSSLRLKKRDMSTSPIAKRQPVFLHADSTV